MPQTPETAIASARKPSVTRHAGTIPLLALAVAGCNVFSETSPDPELTWPRAIPEGGETDVGKRDRAAAALVDLHADQEDEDRIIWYGRRLGYLGLHLEAIQVYSKGLTIHPRSPRLLRHRGHRFISLRRFEEAIADLSRASRLVEGSADEVEPDGMPNARNIPTSTLHTNIWYHLGLAHYCRGDFAEAQRCYRRCLAAAGNPDMEAATRYWLYLTATRLGRAEEAATVLAPVREDWDIIENHAYHRLLLLYAGKLTRDELVPSGDAIQDKTLLYGLARHLFLTGDPAGGEAALRKLVAEPSTAFGCIAAEADLNRR